MQDEDRIQEAKAFLSYATVEEELDRMRILYEETKSPRWLFGAVRRCGDEIEAPKWIVSALIGAAKSVALGVMAGPEVAKMHQLPSSMDKALQITSERGKVSYLARERKQASKDDIFYSIEALRACYQVSVAQACESAYYFMWNADGFQYKLARIDAEEYADQASYQAAVDDAYRDRRTYGESYGATLDSLIDRYHREGAAYRLKSQWGQEFLMKSWAGVLEKIRDAPAQYIWAIESADARRFQKRPEFQEFTDNLGL